MRWSTGVALGMLFARGVEAHWPTPDQILGELRGPTGRSAGVIAADRDPTVVRLLVVRVGSAWSDLSSERRRALAESWREQWREAVPEGIVGIVDATTGRTLVNYDARGRARLTASAETAPRPPSSTPP